MSKGHNIERTMPALYKRNFINQSMFAFVLGCRSTLHTITVKQAIEMFAKRYDLSEEDFNVDSAMVIFFRMQNELNQILKTTT